MSSIDPVTAELIQLGESVVQKAKRAGADAADAFLYESISLGASYRMGKLEDIERSESRDLGLRVFFGKKQAIASSNDFRSDTLDSLVERVVSMAKAAPEEPFAGLAPKEILAESAIDLDLLDAGEPDTDALAKTAEIAETAALDIKGVTNSGGASASWGRASRALVTSNGFANGYSSSSHSIGCSVIAGEGAAMERDYQFTSTRHGSDLDDARAVGIDAAERTLKRLNPRKVKSQAVPVVYDPRVSGGLIGHMAGAITGGAIARGVSFLKDRLGDAVFARGVNVIDDPHRKRGLGSKPFDGEGAKNKKTKIIDDGRLTTWLLDTASARQLKLTPTGHASRGTGSPPSPSTSNLYMEPGDLSPSELIADIKQGLYLTELIGMGVNGVTGDYSRGATGFWIEDGVIAFPVNEITIAGNLKDMFVNLIAANDLEFKYGTNAPTIRVEGMTIAGA